MKIFIIPLLVFINNAVYSQSNSKVLYVQYLRTGETDGWKQWFNNEEVVYSWLHPEDDSKTVPLVIDGNLIWTSDTVLYGKEIKEFHEKSTRDARERKQTGNFRKTNSNILIYAIKLDGKSYIVSDTLQQMTEWAIEPDTLTILGYTCQKATTDFYGVAYVAYFTTELGFIGGPKNFRGLPGLILKVTSPKKGAASYMATEIQYPYKGKMPERAIEGATVSKDGYQKLYETSKDKNVEIY